MVTCMENGDVRVGNRRGGLFAYDCHLDLLERNYYQDLDSYYFNLKKIGLEYTDHDYSKSLFFLLMTINSLKND